MTIATISNGSETGQVTNWAEIGEDDSADYGTTDTDSTPDSDNGEEGESPEDNTVNNENGDEDDHDPEVVQLDFYDLALTKVLTST